jgi:hypothetical protein
LQSPPSLISPLTDLFKTKPYTYFERADFGTSFYKLQSKFLKKSGFLRESLETRLLFLVVVAIFGCLEFHKG